MTSSQPTTWDVIVIGSGIGGLVTASQLAAKGAKVLVLERQLIPGGSGGSFRLALRETAGAACEPELIARTRSAAAALVEAAAAQLLDLSVVKLGRINYVVAYVNPAGAVEASWLDGLRDQLDASCADLLGPVRAEVVLTGRPPFAIQPSASPK